MSLRRRRFPLVDVLDVDLELCGDAGIPGPFRNLHTPVGGGAMDVPTRPSVAGGGAALQDERETAVRSR